MLAYWYIIRIYELVLFTAKIILKKLIGTSGLTAVRAIEAKCIIIFQAKVLVWDLAAIIGFPDIAWWRTWLLHIPA